MSEVDEHATNLHVLNLTAHIVSRPGMSHEDIPLVFRALKDCLEGSYNIAVGEQAVPVGESITDDYLICLDDGLKFKALKRHLRVLGMTPDQYRAKWGLPADYPMTAPNYSATRSRLAKDIGLGKR